jgi:hypothetical protein
MVSLVSWSLLIQTKDVDGSHIYHGVVDSHTTNLTPMWRKAIPFLDVSRDFDGKKCEDILLDLQIGVADATLNADDYRKLNPENGWGDYEGFNMVLNRLFDMCRKHPSGVLSWSG